MQQLPDIIDLPEGQLCYWPEWLSLPEADHFYQQLLEEVPWRQDSILLYGKVHKLPRLQCWYGDSGTGYSYSGIRLLKIFRSGCGGWVMTLTLCW
ncbi:hypothetical protein [Parendozoicomonas sp. Alg238-R29]|uniref:hypothetical protein n=1 Tax=Parendozoicomonas sp. Alg238-R29 TaxID=2993446 RepID=UPI00248DC292|nr:hypothetical protein [Parendozoicomonas sp. Alg238-R29]